MVLIFSSKLWQEYEWVQWLTIVFTWDLKPWADSAYTTQYINSPTTCTGASTEITERVRLSVSQEARQEYIPFSLRVKLSRWKCGLPSFCVITSTPSLYRITSWSGGLPRTRHVTCKESPTRAGWGGTCRIAHPPKQRLQRRKLLSSIRQRVWDVLQDQNVQKYLIF